MWKHYVHTYIHTWLLQTFSQDYGLDSHTIHVVRVNFICEWRTYSLTSTPSDSFLRNFFIAGFCQKSAEVIFFFHISAVRFQNDEKIRVILIISDTYTDSHLYYAHTTSIQSLKYLLYLYLTIRMTLLISTLSGIDIYKNCKISMIRIITLHYSVEGCMSLVFPFFLFL